MLLTASIWALVSSGGALKLCGLIPLTSFSSSTLHTLHNHVRNQRQHQHYTLKCLPLGTRNNISALRVILAEVFCADFQTAVLHRLEGALRQDTVGIHCRAPRAQVIRLQPYKSSTNREFVTFPIF